MKKQFKIQSIAPVMGTPRKTSNPPSLSTFGGSAPLKEAPVYTGTEMLGISIIHKSCLQPIFSKEAAVDAASMRR